MQPDYPRRRLGRGWLFLNGYLPKGETTPELNDGSSGDQGLDLSGAAELRFAAKGEKGGEAAEFFTAGFGYGFTGGFDGWEEADPPTVYPFTYKSIEHNIEHNIDAYAAFTQLYGNTGEAKYHDAAQSAERFVKSMYDDSEGRVRKF